MTRRHCVPGAGPVVVRCGRHGTQTVLTRRPGRSGEGYVSTRWPGGGARTVMPHRTMRGEGSTMTRRPRRGGYATADGRHDAETAPSRCSLCARLVSHPSASVQGGHIGGG